MAHADQGFSAARREGMDVDLLLIPEFQPACLERFGNVDRRTRRCLLRQQRDNAGAQAVRAERRRQRRQHCDSCFLSELMQCVHNDRIPRADQQNLAVEQFGDEDSQNVSRLDTVVRHAEHDEIGQLMLQQQRQLGGCRAFAGNESKFVERFAQECPNMPLRIDNAGAGRHLALSECRNRFDFRRFETPHQNHLRCPRGGSDSVMRWSQMWNY